MSAATRPPVYLHIGAAKTGTTYLQTLFATNRQALRDAGVFYPPGGASGQVLEALDVRRARFKGEANPRLTGAWRRLVVAIRDWQGPALVSSELLAPARPPHIERIVDSLGFADVHIVLTLRDLARQLPAAWQEWIKNRGVESYGEWLQLVRDKVPDSAGAHFWALHDIERILEKFLARVPPERFHVVTVPGAGGDRSLLWTRFAGVIGVDPERFQPPGETVNTSLAAAEARVVRDVNIALGGEAFLWPQYDRWVKWFFAPELATRRGAPIELPVEYYDWAVERSRAIAKAIADAGVDVVGDLAELEPGPRVTGVDPDSAPADLRADAGVAGIAALVRRLADEAGEADRLRAELRTARARLREHADLPPVERTKRYLIELSDQVAPLGAARRGYGKVRRGRRAAD